MNQFTPAREGKCRQLECMLEWCGGMHFVVAYDWLSNYRQDMDLDSREMTAASAVSSVSRVPVTGE